jgi:uncharacterized iron-regulated membrane protein
MSRSHALLKFLRSSHLYLGVFLSPALLFFAITGALQTFSLHETTQGSSYKPPAWIATLAQLHKKQTTKVPVRKQPSPAGDVARNGGPGEPGKRGGSPAQEPVRGPQRHLPMKIFFLLVSLGLVSSTLTGLYMAWKFQRNKVVVVGVFVAGLVAPVLLLPF